MPAEGSAGRGPGLAEGEASCDRVRPPQCVLCMLYCGRRCASADVRLETLGRCGDAAEWLWRR